jgi:hypothetical protein
MKFKFKINETTSLQDIRDELDNLKSANVTEIPFNHLKKIILFLGSTEASSTGSGIRFHHKLLEQHPYYNGYFQIHKVHKGGDQDLIKINDYRSFLYKALIAIIEIKEKL